MPLTIFSVQDYINLALADSVPHCNDGKRAHAGIFSQIGLDIVSLLTFIVVRTTPTGYVQELKKTQRNKNKLGNLKGTKIGPIGQLQIGGEVCL